MSTVLRTVTTDLRNLSISEQKPSKSDDTQQSEQVQQTAAKVIKVTKKGGHHPLIVVGMTSSDRF